MFAWESNTRGRFNFPKRSKLTRRDGFASILQQKAQSNQWFAVYSLPNQIGRSRLGLTVGKRFVRKAVQRNRIKRMIRECFRTLDREGVERDILVRLRSHINMSDYRNARTALSNLIYGLLQKK
ncbi:ribonuclease P protein component [Ferrigenium sp. UT5]|uniref:ribonuclease P protein component n=1 Tax=Ferrigenium sp. UT5 TaxID=3242105 RepID=UPI0038B2B596